VQESRWAGGNEERWSIGALERWGKDFRLDLTPKPKVLSNQDKDFRLDFTKEVEGV
jgi:hypothetical protein